MKTSLGARCDEFYTTSRLALKLGLSLDQESTLHFFDRVRREFPTMNRFRRRDDDSLALEEHDGDDRDDIPRRWIRLEPQTVRFGYVTPPSPEAHRAYGMFLISQAPYHLTISDLNIDHFEVVYGFDLEYNGNHDRLVAETLYAGHSLSSFVLDDSAHHTIDCQPCFGIALTQSCDMQAYLEIKGRTSSFEIRTGEYDQQPLSVYLTVRRYWGVTETPELPRAYAELLDVADDLAITKAVPLIVNPLAQAIASRP